MSQDDSGNTPKKPKLISSAPPPINPVRSSGMFARTKQPAKTPEWREWNHTPSVTYVEACALSMNIDPHSIKYNYASQKLEPKTTDITIKDEFALRLRVLEKNAYCSHFTVSTTGEVPLDEFAAWASTVVNWEKLPSELLKLAVSKNTKDVTTKATTTAPVESELQIEADTQGGQPKMQIVSKGRTDLLTAVIELAKQHAQDPTDSQSVWASLVAMAESTPRKPPLLGFVEEEGVKYQKETGIAFLTKRNLADRMRRAK